MPRYAVTLRGESLLRVDSPLRLGDVDIEPSDDGFSVSREVEAGTIQEAEEQVRLWGEDFSEAMSLVKEFPVKLALSGAIQVTELRTDEKFSYAPSTFHTELRADFVRPLPKDVILEALNLVPLVAARPKDDLVRRALTWFSRGIADSDVIDKFIDHWIALETLSNTYQGAVDPKRCDHCGEVIDPRPDRAVLRGFLGSLGLQSMETYAMKIATIRGQLFHEAKALEEARQWGRVLQNLTNDCLLRAFKQ